MLPRGLARTPLATLALVSALALAGCGDDPDEPGTAAPSASAGASETTSTEPSDTDPSESGSTASEEPSTSASAPTAAPATGPTMQLDDVSLNVPEGWEIGITGKNNQAAYNAGGGPGVMSIRLLAAVPGESFDSTLESARETMVDDGLEPQRVDDVTLDGVQTWVLTGSKKGVALEVQMGGLAGSDTFGLTFQYLTKPPADVQTTIDGVLATVIFAAA